MKIRNKLSTINPRSVALRASVPREIVRALELEKGDEIEWILEAVNSELKVSVVKAKD
jgi:hypothetical protein